ncbi:protein phosphatase 1B isoform X2 [Neodiprion pinetum]|uniref:Protein phosphatase 1B isoform X2 n=1 Tax=Neodiprion lecontei TaxID=441921 RepID=A0ABM3FL12_NEOLC|nr:protein phosphatase 1B isoform X2 [Neodiprion fabricii]XP_046469751.1 protein phosphatase 1B isoform X2 [Neodiprion pinetum]XP_046588676.1 protein phosphatase 1B isoform X2 [Neodiprion lecontei]XP_046607392.1 protein phosphatase 1B isoform X2 [Neodiprion virginianus]
MGAFLDKPQTDKYNEHGAGNGLRYGVASMQGWRVEMEDAHRAITGLEGGLSDWSYFAVFDGHAGALVSAHSAEHLLESIMQTEEFKAEDVIKGIHSGFLRLDDRMRDLPEMITDKSGSTAVCAFISPRQIYIANCGDSRAVLCRSGNPVFSTRDHKPVLPAEKERIQKAGGSVMIQRVNGSLAVSRALGDYEYKNVEGRGPCEQLVSPEPEIFVRERDDVNDEFLVLACDGIWDVMTNEDLCDFIRSRLLLTDDLEAVTNQVIDTCLYKGSRDNMSIVLVTLPGAPKPSAEAQKKEAELEMAIERRIKEIVTQQEGQDGIDFPQLLQHLIDQEMPNLPPGGGLPAKRPFIEQVFREVCPSRANSDQHGTNAMSNATSGYRCHL